MAMIGRDLRFEVKGEKEGEAVNQAWYGVVK